MSIIDDQGRLFGRLNAVDAAIVLLIIAIVPVGYGAYLLFRDPVPRLTGLAPAVLNQGPNLQTGVQGENLRPYMRVSFGGKQAPNFFFVDPKTAVIPLPDLAPGKYDVVLYDYAQEVSRLPGALTIEGPQLPAQISVNVAGAFTGLTPEQSAVIKKGFKFPEEGQPAATVLQTSPPVQEVLRIWTGPETLTIPAKGQKELPALLSMQCYLGTGPDGILRCSTAGVPLGPDANIQLPAFKTSVNFRVSEVHYTDRADTIQIRVRFAPRGGVEPPVAVGDRDIGVRAFPIGEMATIISIGSRSGQAIDATIRLQAEATPTGWTYKNRPVKIGGLLTFETVRYTMDGIITGAELPAAP